MCGMIGKSKTIGFFMEHQETYVKITSNNQCGKSLL